MDRNEALSLGILALNTLMFPEATSPEDYEYLDEKSEDAVEALAAMRDSA